MIGMRFGRLTVKRQSESKYGKKHWLCRCDCGGITVAATGSLNSGRTQSCGCLQKERAAEAATKHAAYSKRTYVSWLNMKARCLNPNATGYSRYGGRGITVCKRWLDFANFLSDMGDCPEGLTLERNDSNGNYTPSNCVWATRKSQSANRPGFVHRIKWKGKVWNMTDLAEAHGMSYSALKRRKGLGWTLKRALTTPLRHTQ